MKQAGQSGSKARPIAGVEETAFLELSRTADSLSRPLAALLKIEALSPNQYNVLRILRGTPEGLACGEIGNLMVTRDPDITRLLDRLEKRELIARSREAADRRVVMARITPGGIKLLCSLDQPVREEHARQLGHLGHKRLRKLIELLREARQRPV